jgi:hypothetical protein
VALERVAGSSPVGHPLFCSYRALELFAVWPLIATGLVCLASGVVLGLGTKYGLVRYWWAAIKLALNVVLVVLVMFALRPGVVEMAEQGRRFAEESLATVPGCLWLLAGGARSVAGLLLVLLEQVGGVRAGEEVKNPIG